VKLHDPIVDAQADITLLYRIDPRRNMARFYRLSVNRGITTFYYTYDFGHYWRHSITLESRKLIQQWNIRASLTANAAPPEYVNGLPGFAEFLHAMAKPRRSQAGSWHCMASLRSVRHRRRHHP
jgi:hypothetical protein